MGEIAAAVNVALSVWSNTCNAHCNEEDQVHARECVLAAGLYRTLSRIAADRAERRAEVEELREDSHNAFQQVAEVARPLGISPDDAHPLDTIERVLAEREKDTAALRAEVERLSDIAMRNADLLIEADERNAALRERVEALDDSLCDALCAARSGKYDGKTVEVHLENLIARLRAALDAGGAGG